MVSETVTPAKAGVHGLLWRKRVYLILPSWIPACAGMTDRFCMHRRRKMPERVIQLQQLIIQVIPLRVGFLNQANLPSAFPFLDRFLARYRGYHITTGFIPHQLVNTVALCKPFGLIVFMLPNPLGQI